MSKIENDLIEDLTGIPSIIRNETRDAKIRSLINEMLTSAIDSVIIYEMPCFRGIKHLNPWVRME